MVFIAPENNEGEDFLSYEKYFKYFSFELSIWQKYAIRALVDGKHCLVPNMSQGTAVITCAFII